MISYASCFLLLINPLSEVPHRETVLPIYQSSLFSAKRFSFLIDLILKYRYHLFPRLNFGTPQYTVQKPSHRLTVLPNLSGFNINRKLVVFWRGCFLNFLLISIIYWGTFLRLLIIDLFKRFYCGNPKLVGT